MPLCYPDDPYVDGQYYVSSEDYEDDVDVLANVFSGMSVRSKKAVFDCGECYSCEHLEDCDYEDTYEEECDECTLILTKIGCQNKWCYRHNCRENALQCNCTTIRLKEKYKHGRKSVFGHFNCRECNNAWPSAFAWIKNGQLLKQDCKMCEYPVKPFKVVSFQPSEAHFCSFHNSFFREAKNGEVWTKKKKLQSRITRYSWKSRFCKVKF